MLSFKEFLNESKESTTKWMPHTQLTNHIHGQGVKAILKHPVYNTLLNHDLAQRGSGNLLHRVKTDKHGFVSVQVASSKKDPEGFVHHATFHLSTSKRKIANGEWQKTKDSHTHTLKRFGYED